MARCTEMIEVYRPSEQNHPQPSGRLRCPQRAEPGYEKCSVHRTHSEDMHIGETFNARTRYQKLVPEGMTGFQQIYGSFDSL